MYVFSTPQNDTYQLGVDEGRRQVLADLANIWKDNESIEEFANEMANYLEQEGYYEKA